MSHISKFCIISILFVCMPVIGTQSIGETRILRWPDGKKAAVSLSFDDNLISQLDIAMPEMEKYGFKGTFFIVAQWLDDFAIWEGLAQRWKEAAQRGHEIGSHSYSHRYLTWLDERELAFQVKKSKEIIERWIGEGNCQIFRHPWGDRDQRTNQFVRETYLWNTADLPTFAEAFTSGERDVEKLKQMIERTISNQGWFVSVFHGVSRDFMPISLTDFKKYLAFLDSLQSLVWVAPMGQVIRYATEREAVKIMYENGIQVILQDSLDPFIYNVPLTLETRLPVDWLIVKISQGKYYQFYTTLEDDRGRFIRYETLPNSEPITIENVKPLSTDKTKLMKIANFNFDSEMDLSNWEIVEGNWELKEGILSTEEYVCKILYRKPLRNFMVRGRFKILSNDKEHSSFSFSGFFLRSEECLRGENNGIYYELDNHSSISGFRNNRVLLWHQWTTREGEKFPWYWPDRLIATFPANIEVDKWHLFEVWMKDSLMLYRLDGNTILVYNEIKISEGKFGLRNRGSQVYFDGIEIFEIK